MRRFMYCLLLLATLAGCGGPAAEPTPAPADAVKSPMPLGFNPVVETIGPVGVGEEIPELRFELDGKTHRLSEYRGKSLLINFWATWCEPCRREMPDLEAISRERADVAVIGVNLRESSEQVGAFAAELNLTFPTMLDRTGDVTRYFGVGVGLPTTYFVDGAGQIRRIHLSALTRSEIEQALDAIK
ncbi:MAG TPA: TlpA disulfide reductase family protein [Herpetosiphonaceae bacterium]